MNTDRCNLIINLTTASEFDTDPNTKLQGIADDIVIGGVCVSRIIEIKNVRPIGSIESDPIDLDSVLGFLDSLDTRSPSVFHVYVYFILYTLVLQMRTNIVIDDALMDDALKLTGLKTKREAVELGLKTLIRLKKQEEIRRFRGKLSWEGDLDEMRTD